MIDTLIAHFQDGPLDYQMLALPDGCWPAKLTMAAPSDEYKKLDKFVSTEIANYPVFEVVYKPASGYGTAIANRRIYSFVR